MDRKLKSLPIQDFQVMIFDADGRIYKGFKKHGKLDNEDETFKVTFQTFALSLSSTWESSGFKIPVRGKVFQEMSSGKYFFKKEKQIEKLTFSKDLFTFWDMKKLLSRLWTLFSLWSPSWRGMEREEDGAGRPGLSLSLFLTPPTLFSLLSKTFLLSSSTSWFFFFFSSSLLSNSLSKKQHYTLKMKGREREKRQALVTTWCVSVFPSISLPLSLTSPSVNFLSFRFSSCSLFPIEKFIGSHKNQATKDCMIARDGAKLSRRVCFQHFIQLYSFPDEPNEERERESEKKPGMCLPAAPSCPSQFPLFLYLNPAPLSQPFSLNLLFWSITQCPSPRERKL